MWTSMLFFMLLTAPMLSMGKSVDLETFQLVDSNRRFPIIKKENGNTGTFNLDWDMDYLTPMLRGKKSSMVQDQRDVTRDDEEQSDMAEMSLSANDDGLMDLVVKRNSAQQSQQGRNGQDLNLPWKLDILRPMLRGKKERMTSSPARNIQSFYTPLIRGKRSYRMPPYNMPLMMAQFRDEDRSTTSPSPVTQMDIGTKQ